MVSISDRSKNFTPLFKGYANAIGDNAQGAGKGGGKGNIDPVIGRIETLPEFPVWDSQNGNCCSKSEAKLPAVKP